MFIFDRICSFEQKVKIVEKSNLYPEGVTFYYRSVNYFRQMLQPLGLNIVLSEPFEISLDLPKPDLSNVTSYTERLESGRKMIMRGDINQPWRYLVIKSLT